MRSLLAFLLIAVPASAADMDPAAVAQMVRGSDGEAIVAPLTEALHSTDALTRAAAARVVSARNVAAALPAVREALGAEQDATAAREELRALAIVGSRQDAEAAIAAAAKWPASMDDAVAGAIARRENGGEALDLYASKLRASRMGSHQFFFRRALWGRLDLLPLASSRVIGAKDAAGWRGLLGALGESKVAPPAQMMAVAFDSPSEEIRAETIWFVARGYALDPGQLPDVVRTAAMNERIEEMSDREAFGRELLRRMLGGEKKTNDRWLKWLDTEEADRAFASENNVLTYLTDDEYRIRERHCKTIRDECLVPPRTSFRSILPRPVAPPQFGMPGDLPAGLADAVLVGEGCRGSWLGVAGVVVDRAGRVKSTDLSHVDADRSCRSALETLMQLTLADNNSLDSTMGAPLLVVHGAKRSMCLDEAAPSDRSQRGTLRAGGDVKAPKAIKRVEPNFPASARQAMARGANSIIILEATITRTGCVRDVQIVGQSPLGELNAAAVYALSQWTFEPGRLDGEPVDVRFTLTMSFKLN